MKLSEFFKNYSRILWLILVCILGISVAFLQKINPAIPKEELIVTDIAPVRVKVIEAGSEDIYTKSIGVTENRNKFTMTSLNSGVVANLKVDVGDDVKKGAKLFTLNNSYSGSGDNQLDIQVDLAENQVKQAQARLDSLQQTESERKDIADEQLDDFQGRQDLMKEDIARIDEQISDIEKRISDIKSLIRDFKDFEDTIEDEADDNPAFTPFLEEQAILQNDAAISAQRSALAQYEATLSQLESQKATLEYQIDKNFPGAVIADLNNEIIKEQIDSEINLAELAVDFAQLNVDLLKSQYDLRTIKSPVDATIEQIYITNGQAVTPGQPLFLLNGDADIVLKTKVSSEVASQVDSKSSAKIEIDDLIYTAKVENISNVPVEGNLFEIELNPDSKFEKIITVGSSFEVNLPIKTKDGKNNDSLYIPLDSVFKTNTSEFVLVLSDGVALERSVETGEVFGNQIEVKSGLQKGENIIVDRRVVPGMKVEALVESPAKDEEEEKTPTPTDQVSHTPEVTQT